VAISIFEWQHARMLLGAVLISGRGWWLPAAAFVGAALLLLFWSYRRAPGGPGLRFVCVTLKLVGLLALAACLLEPLWTAERARPGANFFVLLADNSQGMRIHDRGADQSRGDRLKRLLTAQDTLWQDQLADNFQVRRYVFDSRLQGTKDFSELDFEGRSSNIGFALRSIAERFKGQPLAGILLLTDGNATDLAGDLPPVTDGMPAVYPVIFGNDEPVKDVAVQKITVSQTAFEDAPVTIQAEATAAGYSGETLNARLIKIAHASSLAPAATNASGTNHALTAPVVLVTNRAAGPDKLAAELNQKAGADPSAFRFQIKTEQSGVSFYRLEVGPKAEQAANATSSEATLANNRRIVVVDRGRGPYRILYVSGRPNWEYKFLQRAVLADDQVQLVALIRIARREPKFEFRGRAGESSNPLFRGFGNQSPEETERYDQPVLIRLNTRDEYELRGGFPKLGEELYEYHAVILDDIEAEFFTPDQMSLIQKFVSERGGGFLMLGGMESFQEGKFQRTPIGDLLPVYLDHAPDESPPGDLKFNLDREGWLQPWARLRDNEAAERRRIEEQPPFGVLNKIRGAKPGASVIASVTDKGTKYPALVVQRFGSGRSAALMIGDVWQWGLKDEARHKDMDKAWRQLMRWLVADVPHRVELVAEPQRADPNQAVVLRVRVRDKSYQPLDNATVSLVIRPVGASLPPALNPGTNTSAAPKPADRKLPEAVRLTAEPSPTQPGVYEATYIPRETGGYLAESVVADATGVEVGRAETGWTSDPAADEFQSLKPNRALMETIARQTKGEMLNADAIASFVQGLPNRKAPVTETWTSPLWHQTTVFLFALLCFVAEWGLRRYRGLA
jgi:uncharacterized membrane protein